MKRAYLVRWTQWNNKKRMVRFWERSKDAFAYRDSLIDRSMVFDGTDPEVTQISYFDEMPIESDGRLRLPFRDGAHCKWDSCQLGGIPVFVVYGDRAERVEHGGI